MGFFRCLGLTFLFGIISSVKCIDQGCVVEVQGCAMAFQMGVSTVDGNVTETCLQVNQFLECLDRVLEPCDLATKTSLLDAMNNLIDSYKREPYLCTLTFADNFTVPVCTLEIGACAAYDLQGQSLVNNPQQGCRFHQIYKSCMTENTTSCNGTDRTDINQAIFNSSAIFTECPFNCYNLKQCESTLPPTELTSTMQSNDSVTLPTTDFVEVNITTATNGSDLIFSSETTQSSRSMSTGTNDSEVIVSSQTTTSFAEDSTGSTVPVNAETTNLGINVTTKSISSQTTGVFNSDGIVSSQTTTSSGIVSRKETESNDEASSQTTKSQATGVTQKTSERVENTSRPSDKTDKPVVTELTPTTNQYPYNTDKDLKYSKISSQSPDTPTTNWDGYGNNGASYISVSGLLLSLLFLISSLLN